MGVIVEPGDPYDDEAKALLLASHRLMQELFNPEENHFLSLDALRGEDVMFFVAREFDTTLGTGAIKVFDGYAEVKSMFTAPFARGKGVAALILDRLELEARTLGLNWLRLETGDKLHDAHRLYARKGFEPCEPFGEYLASPASLFMEKRLA